MTRRPERTIRIRVKVRDLDTAERELLAFLHHLDGRIPDHRDAARAYAALRPVLEKIRRRREFLEALANLNRWGRSPGNCGPPKAPPPVRGAT